MSEGSLKKIPRPLQRKISDSPSETIFLLLHVSKTGPTQLATIEDAGFEVRHQTSLIPCYAVSGPGLALKALVNESWLVRVEEDGTVETMQN